MRAIMGKFYGALGRTGIQTRMQCNSVWPKYSEVVVEVYEKNAPFEKLAFFTANGWTLHGDPIRRLANAAVDLEVLAAEVRP